MPTVLPAPSAIPGPSKHRSFFPAPFRVTATRPAISSSKSSTLVCLPPERFRFASIVSSRADQELRKKRHESVQRLRSTWELINEKYGSVLPEEDDEIDLRKCNIVKDRGYLRRQERREFGEISGTEESPVTGGLDTLAFDADEDELGAWDERSGLDLQVPEPEMKEAPPRRTQEDEDDLRAFLRAEAERRSVAGEDDVVEDVEDGSSSGSSSRDEGGDWTISSWDPDQTSVTLSPRLRKTTISVGLKDLFSDCEAASDDISEDEILRDNSDDEEATRKVPVTEEDKEVCCSYSAWIVDRWLIPVT